MTHDHRVFGVFSELEDSDRGVCIHEFPAAKVATYASRSIRAGRGPNDAKETDAIEAELHAFISERNEKREGVNVAETIRWQTCPT